MSTLDTGHAEGRHPSAATTSGAAGSDRIRRQRRRRRRRQPSVAGCSSETTTDGSFRFSDTSEEEYHSWHSSVGSITGFGGGGGGGCGGVGSSGSFDERAVQGAVSGFYSGPCRPGRKGSWGDEDEVDLENGELDMAKVDSNENKVEEEEEEVEEVKDCRICHLSSTEIGNSDDDNGNAVISIELGCACKGDLGNAHKQCAETWFKIKGNTTCEICGAIAINIAGEQVADPSSTSAAVPPAPAIFPERRNFCHGRRIMNFLLACMVFAFVISWLFHFHVLS